MNGFIRPREPPIQSWDVSDSESPKVDYGVPFGRAIVLDAGTHGTVYLVRLDNENLVAAVKQIPLAGRYGRIRELEAHKRLGRHPNVIQLLFYYYSGKVPDVRLNLGMEYAPTNMHREIRQYAEVGLTIDSTYAKLYTYQLFRALGHVHAMGLCHRDVKPRNLLVYPETGALKLCDFGSAKDLTDGRPNVSYICSRHYRAPELLFGATGYTSAVDVWSAGCVYAELMIGEPAFPGTTTEEQRTLVTQLPREMLTATAPLEAARLVNWTLRLTASRRPTALVACAHECYDELRRASFRLPGGRSLPPLFDFTDTEMIAAGHLLYALLPNERLQNLI